MNIRRQTNLSNQGSVTVVDLRGLSSSEDVECKNESSACRNKSCSLHHHYFESKVCFVMIVRNLVLKSALAFMKAHLQAVLVFRWDL